MKLTRLIKKPAQSAKPNIYQHRLVVHPKPPLGFVRRTEPHFSALSKR